MEILFNQYTIIGLRLLHIIGGALWVGGGAVALLLLVPAIQSAESEGQTVMRKFGPRFHTYMGIIANVTVFSGALLYSRFFIATGASWIWSTGPGLAFTFGALAGILSFIIGAGIFGPTEKKIATLGAEMAATGRPSMEQVARMNNLQAFLMNAQRLDFVLLLFALGAMAAARYL